MVISGILQLLLPLVTNNATMTLIIIVSLFILYLVLLLAYNILFTETGIPKKPNSYLNRKLVLARFKISLHPYFLQPHRYFGADAVNFFCATYCLPDRILVQNILVRSTYPLPEILSVRRWGNNIRLQRKDNSIYLIFYKSSDAENFLITVQKLITETSEIPRDAASRLREMKT